MQDVQEEDELVENVPLLQAVQDELPVELEKVPAAHTEQALAAGPDAYPLGHRGQTDTCANEPAVHAVQLDAPASATKPAAHAVQLPALAALNDPALHCVHDDAPAPANHPAPHDVQDVLLAAPLKLPAGQVIQADTPPGEYVPGLHPSWMREEGSKNVPGTEGVQYLDPFPGVKKPGRHAVQLVAPKMEPTAGSAANVPFGQARHAAAEPDDV